MKHGHTIGRCSVNTIARCPLSCGLQGVWSPHPNLQQPLQGQAQ